MKVAFTALVLAGKLPPLSADLLISQAMISIFKGQIDKGSCLFKHHQLMHVSWVLAVPEFFICANTHNDLVFFH
jgi:hypothetical protein